MISLPPCALNSSHSPKFLLFVWLNIADKTYLIADIYLYFIYLPLTYHITQSFQFGGAAISQCGCLWLIFWKGDFDKIFKNLSFILSLSFIFNFEIFSKSCNLGWYPAIKTHQQV